MIVQCRAKATALEKAVDTLLTPLLKAMDLLLSGNGLCSGDSTLWQSATLRDFYLLLPRAAKMNSGVGLTALSLALSSIFNVLHALSQSAISAEVKSNLNQMMISVSWSSLSSKINIPYPTQCCT